MRINTNMAALNAWRNMTVNSGNTQKALEKLSSGFRINRAADDAAGLAVSEKMRAQIRGTNMATRNAQDGISLVQTAEGALTETHSILQRVRELAVQASSGTLQDGDRTAINQEVSSLKEEIDRIADTTQFNGKKLLNGSLGNTVKATTAGALKTTYGIEGIALNGAKAGDYTVDIDTVKGTVSLKDANGNAQVATGVTVPGPGKTSVVNFERFGIRLTVNEDLADAVAQTLTVDPDANGEGSVAFQIGANVGEDLGMTIASMKSTDIGSAGGTKLSGISLATADSAKLALANIDKAITDVSDLRATLGANQNRLEHTVASLQVSSENLSAAESRIRDVDMASEMANFTKNNILQQASQAMLAQANQSTQGILQLLR